MFHPIHLGFVIKLDIFFVSFFNSLAISRHDGQTGLAKSGRYVKEHLNLELDEGG